MIIFSVEHTASARSRTSRRLSGCTTIFAAGCASERTDLQLAGARYADQTPGYAAASLAGETRNTYYGNHGEAVSTVHQWTFETKSPLANVVAFYEREMPAARKSVEPDGDVLFRYRPDGAGPGETVLVRLSTGKICITEEVRPLQP